MSTDSTELTFVRCPSCRSLVPAVSTRCRMCGAGLDAAAKGESEDETQKSSGRVRQKTASSQQDNSFARAKDQVRADSEPPMLEGEVEASPSEESAESFDDDPLSAYIEEVEVTTEVSAQQETPQALEPEIAKAAPEPIVAEPVRTEPVRHEPAEMRWNGGNAPAEEESSGSRVIVESGGRRRNKGGGTLSFGGRKEERVAGMNGESSAHERPQESKHEAKHEPKQGRSNRDSDSESQTKQEAPRKEQQSSARVEAREMDKGEYVARPSGKGSSYGGREAAATPKPQDSPKKQVLADSAEGRLYGWLVSYADPQGTSIELREGKCFVTRQSLKERDLILDDESLSTPHAMLVIGVRGAFEIQDLMSERGVFVRRRGADTYQREEEAFDVENGDWIRFGDLEFLVSLIPYVGVK